MKRLWKTPALCRGTILGHAKPYTRVISGKFRKDARDYLDSQARVGQELAVAARRMPDVWMDCARCKGKGVWRKKGCTKCEGLRRVPFKITVPYRFGLVLWRPRMVSQPRMPHTGGDFDNFCKAILDAAQDVRVVINDGPHYYRGPAPVGDIPSGVYPADDRVWRFEWAFYEALDLQNARQLDLETT